MAKKKTDEDFLDELTFGKELKGGILPLLKGALSRYWPDEAEEYRRTDPHRPAGRWWFAHNGLVPGNDDADESSTAGKPDQANLVADPESLVKGCFLGPRPKMTRDEYQRYLRKNAFDGLDPAVILEMIETTVPLLAASLEVTLTEARRRLRVAAQLDDALPEDYEVPREGNIDERPLLEPKHPKRIGRLRRKEETRFRTWRERPPQILCWRAADA